MTRAVDEAALAIGTEAALLRMDLGLSAPLAGWKSVEWFDAEQGLAGVAKARKVLNIVKGLARAREAEAA